MTRPAVPPPIGFVVLSQGTRPVELTRATDSVLAQGVPVDVLVVGNGWQPEGLGPGVRSLGLQHNLGSPAGRNVGAAEVAGDLIFFLDDDAWIPNPGVVQGVIDAFAAQPTLGALQLKVVGDDGATMRRWVPRVLVGDPNRSGPAFALAEGVTVVRRSAFDAVGGWYGEFFFGHEGVDLAWRLWDAGWDVRYTGELAVRHPSTLATRHSAFYRLNARNRVWLARRNLPVPVLAIYLAVWSLLSSARLVRQPAALRVWWRGFVEGWRTSPGERHPMRWRTIGRLARLGQPPLV